LSACLPIAEIRLLVVVRAMPFPPGRAVV